MASTIKVNNIQNQCGANIINESANTITIGASGDTIQLACGASQTGFGRSGTVDWDTTAKTASFTAVSGNGYFVNTTSGAVTMTLPASPSAGDIVAFKDYAFTFATNNLTIGRNGSNLDGNAGDKTIDTDNTSMSLIYVDATQGWKSVEAGTGYIGLNPTFIVATGGTITTCGNDKIHTFTGPGTFTVCSVGNPVGSDTVQYLVLAGGGGGGGSVPGQNAAGGGAGGYRTSCSFSIPASSYPITIGAGGAGGASGSNPGSSGNPTTFSTITSTAGGYGAGGNTSSPGAAGGSGGGAGGNGASCGGAGNTPPVSPPQGNPGGSTVGGGGSSGGGGGAGSAGGGRPGDSLGGTGVANSISGSPVTYAAGGDGNGSNTCIGAANTGNGNFGRGQSGGGGSGGSGIVIIRYKFQ